MSFNYQLQAASIEGSVAAYGQSDAGNAMLYGANLTTGSSVLYGNIVQFNVGLYSALVADKTGQNKYNCLIGAQNVTPGFGYSDATLLREGDEVIFMLLDGDHGAEGMILARKPTIYCKNQNQTQSIESKTGYERRTHFNSNETYSLRQMPYQKPLEDEYDMSTRVATSSRPTDLVPGEICTLNQHHCGLIGGLYSMTVSGGRAQIRLSAFENRIRVIADSIVKHTLCGNYSASHNRRYLSEERTDCLYQEERLGLKSKETPAFVDGGDGCYHDGPYYYFTRNREQKQTARYRLLEHRGFYGGLSAKYALRPDPDEEIRTLDQESKDAGVARESIDPSGQYRLATTGMLGFERYGRIPVPVRQKQIWEKEVEEPEAKALEPFKHDEDHPYYRQLELADRVAWDLRNSYARYEEEKSGFYVPEEEDLEGKLKDKYDEGFTDSETVKLEKYDKRRSGIWQGEDGSIILRDAWGSEIVMIGGNIQLSCAGNVMVMPGRSSITIAGDDIVQKAQNSVDIHAAKKDVRIDAWQNVQVMGGSDNNPGGITLEARGKSSPWESKGGEETRTTGILLKSDEGSIVTDTKALVLRADEQTTVAAGEKLDGTDGHVFISASAVYGAGEQVIFMNDQAAVGITGGSGYLVGSTAILAGTSSAAWINGGKYPVPITWEDISDVASTIISSCAPIANLIKKEETTARGFTSDKLEKMIFHFRSSEECRTDKPLEVDGTGDFTIYEPFWSQVHSKFETLKGKIQTEVLEDCTNWQGSERGAPWPGQEAATRAKYAKLSGGPVNMTDDGLNKPRKEIQKETQIDGNATLVGGYIIQKP